MSKRFLQNKPKFLSSSGHFMELTVCDLILLASSLWFPATMASETLLSPKGVNFEVAALISLKKEFIDSLLFMEGWDANSVDPCTWNMVGCSAEGFVVSLEMASKGLKGRLSPNIGNLSHLKAMLLQNNELFGSIPSEIGKLSVLQTLDLSANQFSGRLPSSLGLLTQLTYLRLSNNKLDGQIPRIIANLRGLSFLDLSYNNLSGPTPTILAKGYSIAGNNFLCKSASSTNCTSIANPVNETISPSKNGYRRRWVISTAIAITCIFLITLTFFMCWVHWYTKLRLPCTSLVQQDYEFDIGHLKRFSFRELQIATNNFNSERVLGRGGFGVVYKGFLPNKTAIAVKRLRDPKFTGEVQFQTEVEMIGLAVHRNLLRLYGFCLTPKEKLLVYPYMPNGSVADRLRDSGRERPCLDWKKRMNIAIGAARGLLYLHEQCNPRIIHRDVKAANILLDESFEAVVGDFGLAKLLDQRDSHVTTAVRGTVGHIAPEYLFTGQSSEKTDVFGFGILLLELVTGQKPFDSKGMILESVKTLREERREKVMVDRELRGKYNSAELKKMVELALQCCRPQPELRPKMSEGLKVLEAIVEEVAENTEQGGGGMEEEKGRSISVRYSDCHDEASHMMEAMELSGPR